MIKKDIGKKDEKQQGLGPKRKPVLGEGMKLKVKRTKPVRLSDSPVLPPRIVLRMSKKTLAIAAAVMVLVVFVAVAGPPLVRGVAERREARENDPYTVVHATPEPAATPDPAAPPVIDLSGVVQTVLLESEMTRINEPTPWEEELLYSAGQSAGIDEMIFTKLYSYNLLTKTETVEAESEITNKSGLPGELYEGRMNDRWMVWLDTNQVGTNVIHGKNRLEGESFEIETCTLIRPQLRLYGDNLVWVEQEAASQDCLFLYNLISREPVILYSFLDPTYGTCPPSIFGNIIVWSISNPANPEASLLKWLDLGRDLAFADAVDAEEVLADEEASIDRGIQDFSSEGESVSAADLMGSQDDGTDDVQDTVSPSPDTSPAGDTPDSPEEQGNQSVGEEDDPYLQDGGQIGPEQDFGEEIDPGGFAIYPVTNGEVVAYLDGLDPANANLKMILYGKKDPVTIAHGVGRLFGVGSDFIVYTQNDQILLYFWEIDRYARLTAEGQMGRLTKACVDENTVVWYDANDPNADDDIVYVSTVETPSEDLLDY